MYLLLLSQKRAIDIVKKATEEDAQGNFEEAYKQYSAALECFMLAIKCLFVSLSLFICVKKTD